jgi:hypothetical protein
MEKPMSRVRVRALEDMSGVANKGDCWNSDPDIAKQLIADGKAEKVGAVKKKRAKKKVTTRETRKKK